ncbi:M48 family metallopeptidase [Comamonas sp. NoAH]|uniref:M48 family metallopeptidase n=1 Tax=Comamonas halotolerans TaxID=3041496 RepID=UPI0024E0C3E5|nr:SprT family zinc-dependent metalloprotease [Comamonas sp. NoAH]
MAYLLVRSSRRSIGLEVSDSGLTVRAPLRVSMNHIESALQDKARWVLAKLNEREVRSLQTPCVEWRHGASLPYLGGQLQLQLNPAAARGGELFTVAENRWVLHLRLPVDATPANVRALVNAWWLRHARTLFTQRLQRFSPDLGVRWQSLRLSNARTRWGSAKADGSIMLNWRLLHFRLPVLDYVVIHELSHLRVMDHSPRFWAVVASACPDYPSLRAELRQQPVPDWGL